MLIRVRVAISTVTFRFCDCVWTRGLRLRIRGGSSLRTGQRWGTLATLVLNISFEHFRSECIQVRVHGFPETLVALSKMGFTPCPSLLLPFSLTISKTSPRSLKHFPGTLNQPLAIIKLAILAILPTRRNVPPLIHQRPPSVRDRHCTESSRNLYCATVCPAPNRPLAETCQPLPALKPGRTRQLGVAHAFLLSCPKHLEPNPRLRSPQRLKTRQSDGRAGRRTARIFDLG